MLKELFEFIRITKKPVLLGFECVENVFSNFAETYDKEKIIIYANYESADYEGWATVYFYDKSTQKYYEVYGSHCSCYGLENQWSPEEIVFKELENRFNYKALLREAQIEAYSKLLEKNYKA